jgi:hypothetical protein
MFVTARAIQSEAVLRHTSKKGHTTAGKSPGQGRRHPPPEGWHSSDGGYESESPGRHLPRANMDDSQDRLRRTHSLGVPYHRK